ATLKRMLRKPRVFTCSSAHAAWTAVTSWAMAAQSSQFTGGCFSYWRRFCRRASLGFSTSEASAMMSGSFAATTAGSDSRISVTSTACMLAHVRAIHPGPRGKRPRPGLDDRICSLQPPLRVNQPAFLRRGQLSSQLHGKTVNVDVEGGDSAVRILAPGAIEPSFRRKNGWQIQDLRNPGGVHLPLTGACRATRVGRLGAGRHFPIPASGAVVRRPVLVNRPGHPHLLLDVVSQ